MTHAVRIEGGSSKRRVLLAVFVLLTIFCRVDAAPTAFFESDEFKLLWVEGGTFRLYDSTRLGSSTLRTSAATPFDAHISDDGSRFAISEILGTTWNFSVYSTAQPSLSTLIAASGPNSFPRNFELPKPEMEPWDEPLDEEKAYEFELKTRYEVGGKR